MELVNTILTLYGYLGECVAFCILAPVMVVGIALLWLADQWAGAIFFVFGGWQYWSNFLWTVAFMGFMEWFGGRYKPLDTDTPVD